VKSLLFLLRIRISTLKHVTVWLSQYVPAQ